MLKLTWNPGGSYSDGVTVGTGGRGETAQEERDRMEELIHSHTSTIRAHTLIIVEQFHGHHDIICGGNMPGAHTINCTIV